MNTTQSVWRDERGMNTLLVPLIVTIVLFLAMAGFGLWAYMSRQDYKNNTDEKIQTAVEVAVKEAETQKDNEFAEKEKQPLATYQGSASLGSIVVKYPKTWSAYVDEASRGGSLDGYFHPNTVPGVRNEQSYALRLQVTERSFADEVRSYDSQLKNGTARAKAYQPVNVDNVVGLRVEGEIDSGKQGILVMVPLRDKTIKLYTESDQFYNDFNNNVLPNFTFTP